MGGADFRRARAGTAPEFDVRSWESNHFGDYSLHDKYLKDHRGAISTAGNGHRGSV